MPLECDVSLLKANIREKKSGSNRKSSNKTFRSDSFSSEDQSSVLVPLTDKRMSELVDLHLENKKNNFIEEMRRKLKINENCSNDNKMLEAESDSHISKTVSCLTNQSNDKNESTMPAELSDLKIKTPQLKRNSSSEKKKNSGLVGTILYMSPEMINQKNITFATDLWSFGIILYKMLTGTNIEINHFEIGQLQSFIDSEIISNPVIEDSERDLLKVLLSVDCTQRGVRFEKGLPPDYFFIKNLSYFSETDWENLRKGPTVLNFNSDEFLTELLEEHRKTLLSSMTLKALPIVFSGLVKKIKFLFLYNTRQLVLYQNASLVYIDPATSEKKGKLDLKIMIGAFIESKSKFSIQMPTRKYSFESMEYSASEWVQAIHECTSNRKTFDFK